jgi:cytochrome c
LKKYYVALAMLAFIGACSSNSTDSKDKDTKAAAPPAAAPANDLSANPDYQKGLALIAGSDCLTCHKVGEKLTGPAYRDVANKYENNAENVTMLAGKIIKGGQGVWGTIPMTPHAQMSEADAEQMVKYILLLRNK